MNNNTTKKIQLNIKMPVEWHRDLKELARQATIRYDKQYTVQAIIREAIRLSYDELRRRCCAV